MPIIAASFGPRVLPTPGGARGQSSLPAGELQFALPDVLKLPPIARHGNVNEIIAKLGGADQLRTAVSQLQRLLYVA